jgi:hypothetical protein
MKIDEKLKEFFRVRIHTAEQNASPLNWKIFLPSALPRHDPVIQGLQPYYNMGDIVSANCTSDSSHPPASLTWFINGEKVGKT